MTKLRGLVLVALIGLLALCAPPAQAVVFMPAAAAAQVGAAAPVPVLLRPDLQQAAPPGPVLDPANTNEANAIKTRNKAVAAGIAVVLLLVVIWGRRVRAKKRKKSTDQAKGK
jgi:hypothetical protein